MAMFHRRANIDAVLCVTGYSISPGRFDIHGAFG